MKKEQLFEALSEVGDDLITMAEQKRFASPWRKWAPTAAVLAVALCIGALAMPHFHGGEQETAAITAEETEECVVEEAAICEEAPCECIDESKAPDLSVFDSVEEGTFVSLDDVRCAVEEENFDWLAETFVQPAEKSQVKVREAVTEEDRLYLLISLPDEKGVTKEYIIRFTQDGWYYETINELMPDATAETESSR